MKTRGFGRTGVKLPLVGQGTWNLEADDRGEAIAALRRGLELGMTHIDTAEMYGSGAVEEIVGEAIAGRRDEVFLASKVLPQNASRAGTVRACERSLKRLGVEQLDLYLLHWPGPHPLEETFAAFRQLVADGKIRFWGVSNFDLDELERALALDGDIACNQVLYHLGARYVEGALHQKCAQAGVALVGYSPFGSGRFPGERSNGGQVLGEIARARGVTARQVALAFLVRFPHTFAIPKSARIAHVEENGALIDLEESEVARLETAFPQRGSSLPYL